LLKEVKVPVLHVRLVNTVTLLVNLRVLAVLLESIPLVVLLLVRYVAQAKFPALGLVFALDATLVNTTLSKVVIRVKVALGESFRQALNLLIVRPARAVSFLRRLLANALHVLPANTVLEQLVPVHIVMSVSIILQ
jgi:hypothetical protein